MAAHPNKMATDTLCPKRVSEEYEVLIGELGRELAIIKVLTSSNRQKELTANVVKLLPTEAAG